MYQIESSGSVVRSRRRRLPLWLAWRLVSRNVLFLGLTSFFTDISSEMVAAVLPLYLIYTLQLAPYQFGLIDGLYQGAAVLVRLVGGLLSDRWRRYKLVAVAGYGLSALCRVGLLFAGASWGVISALVFVDRTGKGIRTAPRDALIARSAPLDQLATAFGVHRALDTAGAMIGPLIAFLVLSLAPDAFDAIFVVSFCFAVIGLGVLTLFVDGRPAEHATASATDVSLRAVFGLLRLPRFAALVTAGALLGLTTLSDGFVYLQLQRQLDLAVGFFPLLYVVTAFIYMLLAIPIGRLADRFGRGRVFITGYTLLLGVYLVLLMPGMQWPALIGSLFLLGAYYAATDGVLIALASAALPEQLRASGIALLTTATGIARLIASVIFGLLWSWIGVQGALIGFFAGLLVAAVTAAVVVRRSAEVTSAY